ncbi:MaoC/PaaZ C-terminal domain-containing protein [Mameliella sediminis]|uniref:MaoC/PaaZ C-terminal domain-containing protein n=1 Tax=Mameliella sediminis TaxID=2836866 RepID=UPI001C440121|nr:MaoC/PaaZ C-terminal domain-containing protein [Mameliella sediminis]MBV7394073.1 MaoC family dehydratase N-terminal domain-containing protein [Mameliella sediminis]
MAEVLERAEFSPDRLLAREFPEVRHEYSERDSIIYALGVGFGTDPLDEDDLPFVFEEPALKAAPTMAVVLAGPGFWAREADTGIVWQKVLHAEQEIILHRPLPAGGGLTARTRVSRVIDKGAAKGALIYSERTIRDADSGEDIATLRSTTFARGNGGCGGDTGPQPQPHQIPDRAPGLTFDHKTEDRAALLYRLAGDPNPLHADPKVARASGFKAPILHGLCTLGIAGRAILRCCADSDPARFRSMKLRFSSPVYPGETIRTEMWRDGDQVSFRARVVERDLVVLDNGLVTLAGA